MENIDLTKYNCNYEIQFVQLMVDVLKPYIEFQSFDTQEKRVNLAGEPVPRKGLRIFLKKENGIQESIDENGFIQFIQVDFSTIRSEMKEMYTDELNKEKKGKREWDKIINGTPWESHCAQKAQSTHNHEYDKKLEYYGNAGHRFKHTVTDTPQLPEYEKRIRAINNNIRKLEEIGKICFQRTKKIQDVLLFLNNVKDHYNFNPIT